MGLGTLVFVEVALCLKGDATGEARIWPLAGVAAQLIIMPIRRSAAAPPKEDTPPTPAPEPEAKTNSGESTSAEEEQKGAPAAAPEGEESGDAGEKSTENAPEDGEKGEAAEGEKSEKSGGTEEQGKKKKKKDAVKKAEEKEGGEEKSKKVKRKIPAWATMSASKLACAPKSVSVSQPKVEEILLDAIQNCKERSGASIFTIMKYVTKKYSSMEMDKRTKSQYKRAMKKLVEKGLVKQLKGKGFSGSFTIGKLPTESNSKKKPSTSSFSGTKGGTLGEALPLIMTRLCEPKEASYILIKKYLEQHFPQLNVESRPDVLKNCLQRSVEKGFLEQITGKGASGTFQLKKSGNKVLLGGGLLEDAIVAAITAMNEPKCCSITVLRKFLVENHQDKTAYFLVANLKRTLQRCKMMGWMEQITGHGLSGSYQLSYPFYPSPDMLFPEMMEKIKQKEKEKLKQQKRRRDEESDEEEEEEDEEESEEEEEESEDEEPAPRKRSQKRPAPRKRQPPPRKKPKTTSRKPAPAKRPAPPAKKTSASDNKVASKKIPPPPKATPVKKAAPARKPKTPIAKKMTSRVSKRPTPKKTPAKKQATSSAADRSTSTSMEETADTANGTVTRSAEYIGSFPVADCCLDEQVLKLHLQLKTFKRLKRRRYVSLKFSIKGVKVYNEDETTLLMAHALRRISLSIARPSDAQFAFVAHNPGSPDTQLYCHLFKARHARAAQFLNLLVCRCFQLCYLEKHPEEAEDKSSGKKPTRSPSLLNQGFPLSVNALVSFRRAPTQGLLSGVSSKPSMASVSSPEEVFLTSPTLVRKQAMRDKGLRSGAYRSFTYTPVKQRHLQECLNAPQGGTSVQRTLSKVKEFLSHISSTLLAEDVLGSYLLCPHPKDPNVNCLLIRFPSGLVSLAIKTSSNGRLLLENCRVRFESLTALIEHYTETREELEVQLSCTRVNHCYEWEESKVQTKRSPQQKSPEDKSWV
ncbi:hypothetical protein QTP70_022631 [Hemibagrus guttatus]|uniref:Heterochromatin protein 1-binding protein 3 n=1 Tax=Hemibagrus guttatus TaxID=175788 RepID=A0AAE0Q333_9TELE|nr:hypothetical protein QTP70_022631 [Hemibagrus guttatus]